jgi:hypothetical protein
MAVTQFAVQQKLCWDTGEAGMLLNSKQQANTNNAVVWRLGAATSTCTTLSTEAEGQNPSQVHKLPTAKLLCRSSSTDQLCTSKADQTPTVVQQDVNQTQPYARWQA